jgi:hypothetical protein
MIGPKCVKSRRIRVCAVASNVSAEMFIIFLWDSTLHHVLRDLRSTPGVWCGKTRAKCNVRAGNMKLRLQYEGWLDVHLIKCRILPVYFFFVHADLRRGSAAARLLGLRVRIPPGVWMFVRCGSLWVVCSSGRGLCDGLIAGPEESYRLWCVIVCDLETSRMRRLKPASGL